jgi:hypothetical protein
VRRWVAWVIASPALVGCALDFDERSARAERLERTPVVAAYLDKGVYPLLGDFGTTMGRCLKVAGASTDPFTLVADVAPDGRMANVEVRPAGATPECVAAWWRTLRASRPPKLHGGLVIVEKVKIAP